MSEHFLTGVAAINSALYEHVEKGKACSVRFFIGIMVFCTLSLLFLIGTAIMFFLTGIFFEQLEWILMILVLFSVLITGLFGWLSWEWGQLLWRLLKQVDENGHYYARDKIRTSDQTKRHLGKHF
ncbi:hypothetical protein ACTL31_07540 [Leuconostoc mesenteroides]